MAREWMRTLARLLLAGLVLGGVYLGIAWWTGLRLPNSVRVEGVSLGGLTPEQAQDRLAKEIETRAAAPITVVLGDTGASFTLDPAHSGLGVDYAATLDGLSGVTLDPRVLWARLAGSVVRPLRLSIDTPALTKAVEAAAAPVDRAVVDGSVSFGGGRVSTTAPVPGLSVPVADAVRRIAEAFPRQSRVTVDPVVSTPRVGQAAVDAAVRDFATAAMSAPLSIEVDDQVVTLAPAEYAAALAMVPDANGGLTPAPDAAAVVDVVLRASAGLLTPAQDAGLAVEGDQVAIRPAVPGSTLDPAAITAQFLPALTSPERRLTLARVPAEPAVSTEAVQALGVTESVAAFDTGVLTEAGDLANLTVASRVLDGTLVRPGESLRLNAILGERTAAKGYVPGAILDGGRRSLAVGGGLSQLATVVYNLGWAAGAQLVEHHAHTTFLPGYPAGRDAVLSWPDLDVAWTNTTPHAMFVHVWVASGVVHGRLWSTRTLSVETIEEARTGVRAGPTVTDASPGCLATPATPGFDITVRRVVREGELVVRSDDIRTHYDRGTGVVCAAARP